MGHRQSCRYTSEFKLQLSTLESFICRARIHLRGMRFPFTRAHCDSRNECPALKGSTPFIVELTTEPRRAMSETPISDQIREGDRLGRNERGMRFRRWKDRSRVLGKGLSIGSFSFCTFPTANTITTACRTTSSPLKSLSAGLPRFTPRFAISQNQILSPHLDPHSNH